MVDLDDHLQEASPSRWSFAKPDNNNNNLADLKRGPKKKIVSIWIWIIETREGACVACVGGRRGLVTVTSANLKRRLNKFHKTSQHSQ